MTKIKLDTDIKIKSCTVDNDYQPKTKANIAGVKFNVSGLDCASCAQKIERIIHQQSYVNDVALNFSTNILTIDSPLKAEELLTKVQILAQKVEPGVKISLDKIAVSNQFINIKKDYLLIIGSILYLIGLILSLNYLIIASYLIIGYKVIFKAFRNISHGEVFDENFLMTIATLGAIFIGDYPEAVGVMLFYNIGELFTDFAVNKSRNSINALMELKVNQALVIKDDQEVYQPVEQVKIDDVILIKKGEKIPLDGIVIEGESMVDEAMITGESLPRLVCTSDQVISGTINTENLLKVRVSNLYNDSTVKKIIDLLENSANHKAKIDNFITKFAKVYTPVVVAIAFVIGIVIPLLFQLDFSYWLNKGLIMLVVSCPCAIVISVPLSLYAGVGKASSIGALVKGTNYLEQLNKIDTVVFDKTNTITKGSFALNFISDEKLLEKFAYAEYYSNHPLAKAVVKSYPNNIDLKRLKNFNEVLGRGIKVELDNEQLIVGNQEFMQEAQIIFEPQNSSNVVIYLAANKQYLGYLEMADQIKSSSFELIDYLKKHDKETIMLSGDKQNVVDKVKNQLKIDKAYGNLLPADKLNKVQALTADNRKVIFVGDGINDGPVLANSNIGIAMGQKGSDLAISSADIVLMNDDLLAIKKLFKISSFTNQIVMQNIVFAIGIKVIVMVLAAFSIANMWLGVFSDVGVTLLAIINSLRILKS